MKQTIKLRQSELKRVIAESVKRVLNEGKGKFSDLYYDKDTPFLLEEIRYMAMNHFWSGNLVF